VDLTRTLLEWLMVNGPLTLGLVAFVCALGVPLPIPVLMIAAGALVRQGHMHLPTAVVVTVVGALVAEVFYYSIGRKLGPLARTRAGRRFAVVYDEAERRFEQHPGLTVYLTRWLIPPIGIPTNLIAGSSQFPLPRFIAGAIIGNVMWIIGYVALGFAVGNEWQNVSPVFDRYKVYFAGAALLIGLAFVAWRKRDVIGRCLQRGFSAISMTVAPLAPRKPVPRLARITDRTNAQKR
jgi:membrane protein DedA with SNARE-associated domain